MKPRFGRWLGDGPACLPVENVADRRIWHPKLGGEVELPAAVAADPVWQAEFQRDPVETLARLRAQQRRDQTRLGE